MDANNIWAVGAAGAIVMWNGSTWSFQQFATKNNLLSVWVANPHNVVAVGEADTIVLGP